jgi:amino acid adenylation domain
MLALQNVPQADMALHGVTLQVENVKRTVSQYDLSLTLEERGSSLVGDIEYCSDLFDCQTIERWIGHLKVLLAAMVSDESRKLGSLPLLSESERDHILEDFNDTTVPYPDRLTVHELFEQQVERTPDAIAVRYMREELSYRELNQRANQLAHRLRGIGVRSDDRVAICVERGLEMMIGLLGILKAGAAYVPVDPDYPEDRIGYILQDSSSEVLLTQKHLRSRLPVTKGMVVVLLDDDWTYAQQPIGNVMVSDTGQTSANLVYVIYTSGSTGMPKGVMNEHRAVVNRLCWKPEGFSIGPGDVVLQKTVFSFDVSVWEFFWTLLNGACLVMARPGGHQDPDYLVSVINDEKVTMVDFVPSMLQVFLDKVGKGQCRSLRHVFSGGEELTLALQKRFQEIMPDVRLYHMYGPTETAVDATYWVCRRDQVEGRVPIGRPLANTRIYILDELGLPVPIGVSGEIHIAGDCVARGYLNREDLGRDRFVADVFSVGLAGRMYKTGDLGRWRPDGTIEYLGRNDFQVKIRGLRIELGEIEARIEEVAGVREAVVLAREDRAGDKRLVAYWTEVQGASDVVPDVEALRAHLKEHLPGYMVPSAFVRLEELPLTPNGKVDRRALPEPDEGALQTREYEHPQGERENALARIWEDLLNVEKVGRKDNFFDLGGHSLLIVTLVERLRQHGLKTDIRRVFEAGSLWELAQGLEELEQDQAWKAPENVIGVDCERITPEMLPLVKLSQQEIDRIVSQVPGGVSNVQDIYPLAPLQEGILFHHRVLKDSDPYMLCGIVSFKSEAQIESYVKAVNQVIARHDVLRTMILWEDLPQAVQIVLHEARMKPVPLLLNGEGDVLERLKNHLREAVLNMDLSQAPLISLRPVYPKGRDGRCYGFITFHHIIMDHVSLDVMMAEVSKIMAGEAFQLPKAVPYRDFVADSLRRIEARNAKAFFQEQLSDVTEPATPFGLVNVHGDGIGIEEARMTLDRGLACRIRKVVKRLHMSPATLFHVAWALVVARTSGRDDVVFGSVLSGRMGGIVGADRMLGMFVNTLPIRVRLGFLGVQEALVATNRILVDMQDHEQTPLPVAQSCSGVSGHVPLFSAILNYRHSEPLEAEISQDGIEILETQERTNYPFNVSVDDTGEGFDLTVQTEASVVSPERVLGYLCCAIKGIVEAQEAAPETPVMDIPVLPEHERKLLTETFNDNQEPYPRDVLIHELFEKQVSRRPQGLAVVYEGRELNYAELNARANRLARFLRSRGVGPDDRVAICVDRGIEMVIGLMGILKAGGAYVPVDPNYPRERIEYILSDSGAARLLTQRNLIEKLSVKDETEVFLLDDESEWCGQSSTDIPRGETGENPRNLAYIIYTSGSTGKPKGVMLEHSGLCNFTMAHRQCLQIDEESRVLQFASLSFDACTWEVVLALTNGASLHLARRENLMPGDSLRALISESRITHVILPPTALSVLGTDDGLETVRTLVVAGEACPPQMVVPWSRGRRFLNAYGPTETTIVASIQVLTEALASMDMLPIGKPLANIRMYLLDKWGQPVPVGVSGEIHIGGEGVARGYLNRPELTDERFLADPFSGESGARMYRTGDLGRWLPDGSIEYLGRCDFQVKIRGLRIELGEIEARLAEMPQVRDVVVVSRDDDSGDKRLVAYVTQDRFSGGVVGSVSSVDLDSAAGVGMMRDHLKAVLPDYMIPAAFVILDSMPLTPNGKVDRKALPSPSEGVMQTRAYKPPIGHTEELLAIIWEEILGIERVGRNDNFFDLGGHSLLAVKYLNRLKAHGFQMSLNALFNHQTIGEQAHILHAGIEPGTEESGSVQLRVGSGDEMLFFVHEVTGDLLPYIPLAHALPADIGVCGLFPPPCLHPDAPFISVSELAGQYVQAIKRRQAKGPYRVAGWSAAGILAYEIARNLVEQGEVVDFIGMIDTYLRTGYVQTDFSESGGIIDFIRDLNPAVGEELMTEIMQIEDPDRLLIYARSHGLLPHEMENTEIRRRLDVHRRVIHAVQSYEPALLPHRPVLFLAGEDHGVSARDSWNIRDSGLVEEVIIGGTHFSMMKPPLVGDLAGAFSRILRSN